MPLGAILYHKVIGMTAIVIGLGSMGQRRIRLMQKLYPDMTVCGVDTQQTRRDDAAEKWGIHTYTAIADAVAAEKPEAALVCTSPLSHAAIIGECLGLGLHVFTELNLVSDGYEQNISLARRNEKVLFLSSTFLYRDETSYICNSAQEQSKPLSYRYHVGQYLPDWHPWESYTDYFIGNSRTNGCRELLAIELPWLIKAFGAVEKIHVSRRKLTTLKTSYDDSVSLLVMHKNGTVGNLCIDVVSRKAVRLFELIGEDIYLTWNGTPDTLKRYDTDKKQDITIQLTDEIDHRDGYAAFVVENAYSSELKAFFSAITDGIKPGYSFEDDLGTLALIDEIEATK